MTFELSLDDDKDPGVDRGRSLIPIEVTAFGQWAVGSVDTAAMTAFSEPKIRQADVEEI